MTTSPKPVYGTYKGPDVQMRGHRARLVVFSETGRVTATWEPPMANLGPFASLLEHFDLDKANAG